MGMKLHVQGIIASLALFGIAGAALAADQTSKTPSTPSKETREKAAAIHEQMAACLRSDKSIDECRSEMMKNCQQHMGQNSCSMMGMGGGGGMKGTGYGMHGSMQGNPPNPSTQK